MASAIRFLLTNFTLTFLALGFAVALVIMALGPKPVTRERATEALLSQFLLFSIGIAFFYNFVIHVFFGAMAAHFIGWADSPFQAEVGFASLGFAAVGLMAFRGGGDVRLAAIVGPALFLWGAAAGHIYQMRTQGNFAPGNAGIVFWTDILLPVIGFALYAWWRGGSRR